MCPRKQGYINSHFSALIVGPSSYLCSPSRGISVSARLKLFGLVGPAPVLGSPLFESVPLHRVHREVRPQDGLLCHARADGLGAARQQLSLVLQGDVGAALVVVARHFVASFVLLTAA
jgi:hypothetical protein